MPVTKTVRRKGATIVTTAYAEVLFTRGGPVGNFTRTFTRRVKTFTAAAAPGNSRPTWGHEPAASGRSLKQSFVGSTRYDPARLRVYSAVGSTANYSAFVDQGTGIHNGGNPWKAKILPPRTSGGSDLYESSWEYSPGHTPRDVWIKGQRPQRFFKAGLDRAFKSVRIPTVTVPGDGTLGSAVSTFPDDLTNFGGASIDASKGSAFRTSLEQWRKQRDAAWNSNEILGQTSSRFSRKDDRNAAKIRADRKARANARAEKTQQGQRERNRLKQQKWRDDIARAKGRTINRKPPTQDRPTTYRTVGEKKDAAIAALTKRNPNIRIVRRMGEGVVVSMNGRETTLTWGQLFGLLKG